MARWVQRRYAFDASAQAGGAGRRLQPRALARDGAAGLAGRALRRGARRPGRRRAGHDAVDGTTGQGAGLEPYLGSVLLGGLMLRSGRAARRMGAAGHRRQRAGRRWRAASVTAATSWPTCRPGCGLRRRLAAGRRQGAGPQRRRRRPADRQRAQRRRPLRHGGAEPVRIDASAAGVERSPLQMLDGQWVANVRFRDVPVAASRCSCPGRSLAAAAATRPTQAIAGAVRRGTGRDAGAARDHARLCQDAQAVRRDHRLLPGAAAPAGGHVQRARADALAADPRRVLGRRRQRRGAARPAGAEGDGRQGRPADRRRGGADARRHGHDRRTDRRPPSSSGS